MKISMGDKLAIVTKIRNTLVEKTINSLPDPEILLQDIYIAWWKKEIWPNRENNLYKILPRAEALTIKFEDKSIMLHRYYGGDSAPSYREASDITSVTSLAAAALPSEHKDGIIVTIAERYSEATRIDTKMFPAEEAKIKQYNADFAAARQNNEAEIKRVKEALDELNTYKQLQTHLPVIFNSMPDECTAKYDAYKNKVRKRSKKATPIVEASDFSDLGATLAVEALKKTIKP